MNPSSEPVVLFREDQRFRQPVLWAALIVFSSFALGTAFYIMTRAVPEAGMEPSSSNWHSWALLTVFVVLPISLTLILVAAARLSIEVSSAGLFVRFFPLHRKVRKIDLQQIESVEPISYHPVRDYGGYGIRLLPRAKAYNTGGDQGVRIRYRNGYHLLLGTRHPDALCEAITRVMPTLPPETEEDAPPDVPATPDVEE